MKFELIPSRPVLLIFFSVELTSSNQSFLTKTNIDSLKLLERPLKRSNFSTMKWSRFSLKKTNLLSEALEEKKKLYTSNFLRCFQQFYKDPHTASSLIIMDNKLCWPYALKTAAISLLHKTHPGYVEMKLIQAKSERFYSTRTENPITDHWARKLCNLQLLVWKWRAEKSCGNQISR